MYYIVYPLLYLVSLLPFFILYRISDLAAFILGRIVRYRRDIILGNLQIAFPEKTGEERRKIARKFYQYFTDTFIETLKMISISKKQLLKRNTSNYEMLDELVEKGYNINILAGHQFNWEYGSLLYSAHFKIPMVAIYIPISNKIFSRIFFNFRTRYGAVFISAAEFKEKRHDVFKNQYIIALGADQNPGDPSTAYWYNFFGRPTPFVTGPERGAIKNNAAVVYFGFRRIKRGYYHFEATLLAERGADTKPGELTRLYKDALEKAIRTDPPNYLWSHRRFKFDWKPEYGQILG